MHWEELTGDQFPSAVTAAEGVCLVPLSCLERHAHHLPLGTDILIGRELCHRAAVLEPAIVFPDVIFTQILEARHYPGAIALEANLILRLLDSICQEIARNGLTKVVLVSSHGGNEHLVHLLAQAQLAHRRDYVLYVADPHLLPEDEATIATQWETAVDGHAGEQETSQMLAIRPELVHLTEVGDDSEGMPRQRLDRLRQAGVYTGIWWYADHPTHYRGAARPATADKGERYLAARARALAAAVRAIKDDREAQRLQEEFFDAGERHGVPGGLQDA
jgi:creatinine amidohydrolase